MAAVWGQGDEGVGAEWQRERPARAVGICTRGTGRAAGAEPLAAHSFRRDNDIGPEGATILARPLAILTTLKSLYLWCGFLPPWDGGMETDRVWGVVGRGSGRPARYER
jgi:hypothetical protein